MENLCRTDFHLLRTEQLSRMVEVGKADSDHSQSGIPYTLPNMWPTHGSKGVQALARSLHLERKAPGPSMRYRCKAAHAFLRGRNGTIDDASTSVKYPTRSGHGTTVAEAEGHGRMEYGIVDP